MVLTMRTVDAETALPKFTADAVAVRSLSLTTIDDALTASTNVTALVGVLDAEPETL